MNTTAILGGMRGGHFHPRLAIQAATKPLTIDSVKPSSSIHCPRQPDFGGNRTEPTTPTDPIPSIEQQEQFRREWYRQHDGTLTVG